MACLIRNALNLVKRREMSRRTRPREPIKDVSQASPAHRRPGHGRKPGHVPEGDALLAPRLMGTTPRTVGKKTPHGFQVAQSPSPIKCGGMSLSRLHMLAKPKMRR
ncbi:hypothetical protein CT0861_07689 [Colletotrichum tofieldiae]|uniref:Uncharacterized protein n=1 Tax=Colletotrichum tofieldiae TaxID=708197 RepID=A0A166V8L1_9PEZI|nr:hypothetical protein CT0861_07689 [Colletotrichum tofieldiae]